MTIGLGELFYKSVCAGLLLAVAGISGCGGSDDGRLPTAPVEVTVTYKGKPVEGAVVTFTTLSPPPAFAKTDAAGVAKLTTYEEGDGAILGSHKVMVVKQEFDGVVKEEADTESPDYNPAPGASPLPKVKDLLPKKYTLPGTTDLTAEVVSGQNKFTFDLK
jgi:hypothetical protein